MKRPLWHFRRGQNTSQVHVLKSGQDQLVQPQLGSRPAHTLQKLTGFMTLGLVRRKHGFHLKAKPMAIC